MENNFIISGFEKFLNFHIYILNRNFCNIVRRETIWPWSLELVETGNRSIADMRFYISADLRSASHNADNNGKKD